MTDTADTQLPDDPHHPDAAFRDAQFEGWQPTGEVVPLVAAADEAGVTIQAVATTNGTVAIATTVTKDSTGEALPDPVNTVVQLDPAALIHLAGLVPIDSLPVSTLAEVIPLHPAAGLHDIVVEENGVRNAPCQVGGCERRIQYMQPAPDAEGEWQHVPDVYGLTPKHTPVPPADLSTLEG